MLNHPSCSDLNLPLVVLIDDNCYYSSMRYEYHQMARKFKTGFCQLTLQIEVNEALQRNEKREDRVPCDVIKNMAAKFEAPNPLTNSWERFSFALECDQVRGYSLIIYHNWRGCEYLRYNLIQIVSEMEILG